MVSELGQVGNLLERAGAGRKDAADELFSLLYPELRRMAARHMARESSAHSWQPTLLVNELYLELLRNKALSHASFDDSQRGAFLGFAGFLMKRLLIVHSRPARQRAVFVGPEELDFIPAATPDPETLQRVDSLLEQIANVEPGMRTVVELRVFEGKTHEEIAAQMGCSVRTVGSYWAFARRIIEKELGSDS